MKTLFNRVPIETVSNYWNNRPCNIRHSKSAVGTRQYFDEVEARKYHVEPHIPSFANFGRWGGKRVLEIGCGIGTDTINFARAGALVTAVDVSEASLALANKRAAIYGLSDQIQFFQANAEELSRVVKPQVYDLVYSFGVIHHTPHPERVMSQIRQFFVSPGTTLKLMVYHRNSYKVARIVIENVLKYRCSVEEMVARHSEAQMGCPVTYTYTQRSVQCLLEGFTTREVAVDHIFPYRIPDYAEHRYVKDWLFGWMPKALFRALERRWGWHLLVTAVAQ